jgi:hypothetical protein
LALPFAGHPLQKAEGHSPFFIIGSSRSGTTLLRRMLLAHPDLFIPPETNVLEKAISLFRQCRSMSWQPLVYLVLSRFEYHPEFERFGVSLRPLAQRLVEVLPERRSLALILDSLYRYLAEESGHGCRFWGDKTPRNTLYLDKILRVFPRARFVHLLRDGCDVVSSLLRAKLCQSLEDAATIWLVMTRAADRFCAKHAGSCVKILYEGYVREPAAAIGKVCGFLGVEFREDMLGSEDLASDMGDVPAHAYHARVAEPVTRSSIGKGRRELTDAQKRRLDELIGDELVKQGYPLCSADVGASAQ